MWLQNFEYPEVYRAAVVGCWRIRQGKSTKAGYEKYEKVSCVGVLEFAASEIIKLQTSGQIGCLRSTPREAVLSADLIMTLNFNVFPVSGRASWQQKATLLKTCEDSRNLFRCH